MTKWWAFSFPLTAIILVLAGCGGSTANVQNPQPPPQSSITIAFQPQPPSQLAVSFSESVTAVVSNDSSNDGVAWVVTCQVDPDNESGLCGSLSAPHTASGTATTYTAPASLTTGSMVVEIVAYAAADETKNAVAPVTVTTFDSNLKGNYVLQAQGADASFNPYQFAGVVVLDGNGGITSGEQTLNFLDPNTGALITKSDTIVSAGSSYFLGSDGRGTVTLNPNGDPDIGTESFSFVFLSSTQALVNAVPNTLTVSGTGTMDLQPSAPSAPSGGYAFTVSGDRVVSQVAQKPLAIGGVFNIDSPNTISGAGSVVDEILGKNVNATAAALSGTLTQPDQFGAVTLNLTAPVGSNGTSVPLQFTGYIVDDTHIKMIESDNTVGSSNAFGATAGVAIGQGSATGTFQDGKSFSGTYVFGVPGVDLSNSNIAPSTLTSAGVFTADGAGNLTNGFTDTFLAVNTAQGQAGAQISAAFGGTYSVDSNGTGRATLTLNNFSPTPKHGYQPVFFFYLAGIGNPSLVLEGGDTHYPSLGAGIAYEQSTGNPAYSGVYGMSFTQQLSGISENDATAQMNVNSNTVPPSLSGFADVNLDFSATPDQLFTGSFSAPASNGIFQGVLGTNNASTGNNNSSVFSPPIAVDYYAIDSSRGFFIETDLLNAVPPEQTGQVSLGYYAERTPVCEGCP